MQNLDLTQVIKEIRDASKVREKKVKNVFPYIELYPKIKRREGGFSLTNKKQILMRRIREKYQELTNPYQHEVSLKRDEVEVLLPRIRDKDLENSKKELIIRKRLNCHSVTPTKTRNILYYRLPLSHFDANN